MMAEDETKKDAADETPQDEATEQDAPRDEASQDAGPAGAGDPPPPPAASDESGEEAGSAEEADAPAAGEAEAEQSEPNPEDDLPWKERRRLQRSRLPHDAKPQRSVEERKTEREAVRKRKAEERRKERAVAKKERTKGTGTPVAEQESNAAKVRQGIVVSDKGQKSITVRVDIVRRHPTYEKVIRRSRTLHAHDERNEAGEGDTVRVVETRPLSKTKRWRLVEVLEKAK
jgi:small subunit ribosomal protein S17